MTTITQSPDTVYITAIWSTRHGCDVCGTVHDRYHVAVTGNDGREVTLRIDPDVFAKLVNCATPDDFRDGDYIGFAQPLIFPEALS